jgi:hypothetical protein
MYFNLVMNAVDAMNDRRVGVLKVSEVVEGNHAVLRVQDDGEGMTPEKVAHLMRDPVSLDGELHSLGFVFVRQTVADFGGQLTIDSRFGSGTTITIRIPRLQGVAPPPRTNESSETELLPKLARIDTRMPAPIPAATATPQAKPAAEAKPQARPSESPDDGERPYGRMLLETFRKSEAQSPGCIFMIAVSTEGRVDAFTQRPYERLWDISHEDLAPMLWQTVVRGRIEEDESKEPMLILKPPSDSGEYFDFRSVPDEQRRKALYVQMVCDEYVRVARKLIATGLPPAMPVVIADARRFYGENDVLAGTAPTTLGALAERPVGDETSTRTT